MSNRHSDIIFETCVYNNLYSIITNLQYKIYLIEFLEIDHSYLGVKLFNSNE